MTGRKIPNIGNISFKRSDNNVDKKENDKDVKDNKDENEKNIGKNKMEKNNVSLNINENGENNNDKLNNKEVNDELAIKIKELEQKNSELEKKLLYLASEYDNLKKRSANEVEDATKFAINKFAISAINIYDVLLTAISKVDENKTDKVLFDGIKMTVSEFEKMFDKIQIKRIVPEIGSIFDHNKQEAISRIQNEMEAGCIVDVIRAGYELYDRLIRPAMVVVSGGKN